MNTTTGKSKRRGRWQWGAFLAAVLSSVAGIGLLALLLLPPLLSATAMQIADDSSRFEISARASVVPGQGWSVQPLQGGGLRLRSPDRVLEVTMSAADESHATVMLEELETAGAGVKLETLAGGSRVQHVTSGSRITAALEVSTETVLIRAETADNAKLGEYRVALAELLLRVQSESTP